MLIKVKKDIFHFLSVFITASSKRNSKIQVNFSFLKNSAEFNERISGMKKTAGSAFRFVA